MKPEYGQEIKKNKEVVKEINQKKKNSIYLPNISLPGKIIATINYMDLKNTDMLIIALPSRVLQSFFSKVDHNLLKDKIIISVVKGLVNGKTLSEYLKETNKYFEMEKYSVLTGPNFAIEIVQRKPTVSVLASKNEVLLKELTNLFRNDFFM